MMMSRQQQIDDDDVGFRVKTTNEQVLTGQLFSNLILNTILKSHSLSLLTNPNTLVLLSGITLGSEHWYAVPCPGP